MYVFIDTETGGLTTDYSLLTVSALIVDENFNALCDSAHNDELYLEIRQDTYVVTPEALAINKIDLTHHSAKGLRPPQAREKFAGFISQAYHACGQKKLVPAGHNVAYDLDFIWHYLMPVGEWRKFCTYPALDTAIITRFFNSVGILDGPFNLTDVCAVFGIKIDDAHNAAADNKATLELAKRYTGMLRDLADCARGSTDG